MPIYEYRCEKCGEFEVSQRITEPALERCPTCKRKVRRLISNTSFQLKGSGWYVTDYARASGKEKGKRDAAGDAASATGGSEGSSTSEGSTSGNSKTESAKSESKKSASA
jgi:putative FmdB family regulatory protein